MIRELIGEFRCFFMALHILSKASRLLKKRSRLAIQWMTLNSGILDLGVEIASDDLPPGVAYYLSEQNDEQPGLITHLVSEIQTIHQVWKGKEATGSMKDIENEITRIIH